MSLPPMDRRRANSAFEALAYSTADAAQLVVLLDASAAGLASADLPASDAAALDDAAALIRHALGILDRAADHLLTAIATTAPRPVVTVELPEVIP